MRDTVPRDEWIAELREWIGTPFRHQGRTKGVGADCVGMVASVARDMDLPAAEAARFVAYGRMPHKELFSDMAADYMDQLPYNRLQPIQDQAKPGDVIFFWIDTRDMPRHVGVYTGLNDEGFPMMIHAHAKSPRAVVEMPINAGYWQNRIVSIWTFPFFED